jgi:uncharacterized damage-inducible protein DinB
VSLATTDSDITQEADPVSTTATTTERDDLVSTLDNHRRFLKFTARDLTDEQAAARTTVSELCIGGLIKHVTLAERGWARFIVEGAPAMSFDAESQTTWARGFQMDEGDTLAGLLKAYDDVADATDELVRTLPDLDAAHELPKAPWFPPGATWTARRVLLHILAETSQHAGHADIIREALDGSKTMG